MAVLALQSLTATGTELTFTAASDTGDLVPNNGGGSVIAVKNDSDSPITVTATATRACSQGFTHDLSESVGAGKTEYIKLPSYLNNSSNQVPIAYSSVTDVTVAAFK